MIIRKIAEEDFAGFKKLFCDYYAELDCEDDPLHLFDEYVLPDLKAGLFGTAVAQENGALCGFVIFQIDDVINDWCFKEGCGDVRELYVVPARRNAGTGRKLLTFAEEELIKEGAGEIYLLPDEACEGFFTACGYSDCGEYCPEADSKVFNKTIL